MSVAIYGNGTTTASSGANTVTHYYDRAGIKAANAISVYAQFADNKSQPRKMGKTFKISKWQHIYDLDQTDGSFAANGYLGKRDLTIVSAALAETNGTGATITEGAGAVNQVIPTKVTVTAELNRYGFMTEYTDEAVLFSEDDVQVKYREELGYLMGQTNEDLIQKDMLNGAGIVINAAGVTVAELGTGLAVDGSEDDTYRVSFDLIRKGVKALVRNRAQRNTEIVTGSTKIGTTPVNKAFYGIIGPEVKYDLETSTRGTVAANGSTEYAYVPAYKYSSAATLAESEVGQMHDVRFIESEGALMEKGAGAAIPASYAGDLSNDGTNFDVFPVLFPTKGAFATVGLKGTGRIKFYAKSPSDVSLDNPHATKGFFSAQMFYAGLTLQPEKMLRVNVLATA